MTGPGPTVPACYRVRIVHERRDPLRYRFAHRGRVWLVDLDGPPRLPRGLGWACRFDGRDHLGGGPARLRAGVDRELARLGAPRPARVLLLARPRVFGYVFNPLSLYYCYAPSGRLACVLVEVRNTYHGRHSYLLHPDQAGRADAGKVFYVSPFHPVEGSYRLRVPAPEDTLVVAATLRRPGAAPFTATMTGRRVPRASLWGELAQPLGTRAVMARIWAHGLRLYAAGLRPYRRTTETA